MLVTIIMPSFQQGRFIEQSIRSVLDQQNCEVEILLYDSCSTDGTGEVLNKLFEKLEFVVERDLGQGHAINKGLSRCSGDIIGFLNSDDLLLPDALNRVVQYFEKKEGLDLLYGKGSYINEEGHVLGDYKTESWDWDWFRGECFICQPAAFWSRRILEKIGLFDQKLHCSMDYDYWIRIHQAGGKIERVDNYLACSRDYSTTKTRSMRGVVFRENFRISLRRIGRIHPYWIEHYIDYLRNEERVWWRFLLPSEKVSRQRLSKIIAFLSPVWAKDIEIREFGTKQEI